MSFVVNKRYFLLFSENDIQFVYIFINKVCTDMLLQIIYCFYKKKCLLLYQSIHLSFMTFPSPFCVCFTVFYILNRQVDLRRSSGLIFSSFLVSVSCSFFALIKYSVLNLYTKLKIYSLMLNELQMKSMI